jgi:hypothetical protein
VKTVASLQIPGRKLRSESMHSGALIGQSD